MSTTNQQNLSTIKNVDLRKSHPHQQNWSIVQIVDSLLDPNQQMVSLKIGETTKCTLGFFLHNNKFVDQQSGSNVQIVVSGPTSTNCVIPNLPRGSRQLYQNYAALILCRTLPCINFVFFFICMCLLQCLLCEILVLSKYILFFYFKLCKRAVNNCWPNLIWSIQQTLKLKRNSPQQFLEGIKGEQVIVVVNIREVFQKK